LYFIFDIFYNWYYTEYKSYQCYHYELAILAGPSEKYWQVIAERRRKALEEVLEQNRKLHNLVLALEDENASCKKSLEQTTDLVNTLKVYIK